MRITVTVAAACLLLAGAAAADQALASIRRDTNIPAQNLAPALKTLAKERGIQVVYRSEIVGERHTEGAAGDLTLDEALTQLLKHTGLTYRYLGDKAITIIPITGASSSPAAQDLSSREEPDDEPAAKRTLADSSRNASSWSHLQLAQLDQGAPAGVAEVGKDGKPQPAAVQLQEVIVTAQKREERLQDVPVPVTAIRADTLVENNQVRLQDYSSSVPGLNVTPQASTSYQILSIRGITTTVSGNPTVGITIDDVPYGASTMLGGGQSIPDLDPGDLARIEVLRGPQGTLYGASSMGGLLKFVTVDPSTDAVSGRVQADVNGVKNGAEPGYGVRGSVNVPLSDTLAIRASAFTRRDPGYIDNVQTGRDGVNESRVGGGRLSALWRPSENFSLKLSALYQDARGDGTSDVDVLPGLGDLQQSYLRGTGGYDRKVQAYSAIATLKLGRAELTSLTGYNVNEYSDSYDLSYLLGGLTHDGLPGVADGFGVTGTPQLEHNKVDKVTQEIRLATPIGSKADWLIGGFYTHESTSYTGNIDASDPASGAIVAQEVVTTYRPTYQEYAAFSDLTFHFTDQFDIQIGARESHTRETYSETDAGPFVPVLFGVTSPLIRPEVSSGANAFTYLFTPRLTLSPDLMIYARLASGYRAGGTNYSAGPGFPLQYEPDRTENYEIGMKAGFLDRMLSVDASIYYIKWRDIQILSDNPDTGLTFTTNGGRAKSEGIELSVELRPFTGLTVAAWGSYDNAVLTQEFPATSYSVGAAGDRLPYTSRLSGNLSVEEDFPITSRVGGFVGGAASFVGHRLGEFASIFTVPPVREDLPAYTKLDLRTGVKLDDWTISLFVNNVADRRGLLYAASALGPLTLNYIQPRTVGLSVLRKF